MTNNIYSLIVNGTIIPLRRIENIRLVTPERNERPVTVASRLARSSRIAIDSTYPPDLLVVWGDTKKLKELQSYPDINNTRAAFQDPDGNLLILTNDILIGFSEGSSDDDREKLLAKYDGQVIERKGNLWKYRVNDPADDAPLLLANEISNENIVNYAEPNAVQSAMFAQLPQNEPRFSNQWHLRNTGQNGGTVGADIDALGAWAITTGSLDIKIVVHDGGVDINHPDLRSNIGPGWDFANNDNDPTNPDDAHGTACAGIIAAAINGQGVVGIAPRCKIIPLKTGKLTWEKWAETFDWAARNGQIISCSWSITENNTLSDAIRRAVNNGATIFCCAQNWYSDHIAYPARMPETIAVGASTNLDVKADYSNYGIGLDIVAPGGLGGLGKGTLGIETTDNQGTDGYNKNNSPAGDYCNANDGTAFAGTSAATPLVAGIAGLMLSVNPHLTPEEIRAILRKTAVKIDQPNANYDQNGWSPLYGFGRVSASAAVNEAAALQPVDLNRLISICYGSGLL